MFSKHLYTRYYPDPDLLIRTSGEMRISNFLLWQLSYTEMYVTPKLWPDFGKEDRCGLVREFRARQASLPRRRVTQKHFPAFPGICIIRDAGPSRIEKH